MADTDALRPYKVGDVPTLPGGDKLYLAEELKRISQSITLAVQTMKKLEARMVAGGL
jgi:hypothetical protein